jgi:hypothetical protein
MLYPGVIPAKRRVGRRRRHVVPSSPTPAGLTLVSVAYEQANYVELMFNEPIDIDDINGEAFRVFDANVGFEYTGTGLIELMTPATVRLGLVGVGDWFETGVWLDVSGDNGITSADDEQPWAGVTDLAIPFP